MTTKVIQPHPRFGHFKEGIYEAGYMKGSCYAFAIALSRITGWPMVGIVEHGHIYHVATRRPDGNYHDVRGVFSENDFGAPFNREPPYEKREVNEAELQELSPMHELLLAKAKDHVELLFPELAGKDSFKNRVVRFADELEALCRKHGLWVSGPSTAQPAYIDEADDAEVDGYDLQDSPIGQRYGISRRFK